MKDSEDFEVRDVRPDGTVLTAPEKNVMPPWAWYEGYWERQYRHPGGDWEIIGGRAGNGERWWKWPKAAKGSRVHVLKD